MLLNGFLDSFSSGTLKAEHLKAKDIPETVEENHVVNLLYISQTVSSNNKIEGNSFFL